MAASFYLPSDPVSTSTSTPADPTDSENDSDEIDTLPYPAELSRNDFLSPSFDPQTYLSTLRNRHQTLEDLRSDLRQRSQLLSKELLDLVNGNYEEFLSLGSDLQEGEEKVEGVRVGLLGFERELEGIKKAVQERSAEIGQSLDQRRSARRDIGLGRRLLEIDESVSELESSLGIQGEDELAADVDDLDDSDEDETEADVSGVPIAKLRRHTKEYLLIVRSVARAQPQILQGIRRDVSQHDLSEAAVHPFLQTLQPRINEVRKTLLLDLAAALRQAKTSKAQDAVLAIVRIYADLGAESEGIKALKGS